MVDSETFELPSKGLVYTPVISSKVTLRALTLGQVSKILNSTNSSYKICCDTIEECLIDKLPIHVSDMCEEDFIFLLNKLNEISYGSNSYQSKSMKYKLDKWLKEIFSESGVVGEVKEKI